MAQAARRLIDGAERGRRWHNALPEWIEVSPEFARLRQSHRRTLQAIADACDGPNATGDLLVAFGGGELAARAGCSVRTLWRHVRRLEAAGFVVCVGRGGVIGDRNYGNQYGVPGARGSLDRRRARRAMRRMIAGPDGVYRPIETAPGEQVTLWRESVTDGGGSDKLTRGGSDKLSRGSCQTDTLPSPIPSPMVKNHGVSRQNWSGKRRRRRLPNIAPADLADTGRLLGLWRTAATRGLVDASEAGRLRFVAAAERALRVATEQGGRAVAIFAGIVLRGCWENLSGEDEDAAQVRLRVHDDGGHHLRAVAHEPGPRPGSPGSADAELARRARAWAARVGFRGDVWRAVAAEYPDWTRERWAAAVAELERTRRERTG